MSAAIIVWIVLRIYRIKPHW